MQEDIVNWWTKDAVLTAIQCQRLIPVVRAASRRQALCAAEGVMRANFPLIEITLTIPGALNIIQELSAGYRNQLIVGAGTVLDAKTCDAALQAGAGFIVSPSLNVNVIHAANSRGVACIAGALTPSEVVTAHRAGADMVKIFPCGLVGGPHYIRALKGPLPEVQFVPSSGVNMKTADEFFEAGSTAVAVGEPIFQKYALETGNSETIYRNISLFIQICRVR